MNLISMRLHPLFLVPLLFITACSDKEKPYVERPVEQLYHEAYQALESKHYKDAAELFEEVERQHPYSSWATQSEIMAAYALYQNLKYDEAVLMLDNFIQIHPGNEEIAYAYYLRALCYYEQISDVKRDQQMTEFALGYLREIVQRFPNTEYAKDAALKIALAEDHLAGKEMEIGRYYLKQKLYNAAIHRFDNVLQNYQTSTHVPEALHRLTEAYLAIGVTNEAKRTASILGYNYPGSEWYTDSYALLVDPSVRPEEHKPFYKKIFGGGL